MTTVTFPKSNIVDIALSCLLTIQERVLDSNGLPSLYKGELFETLSPVGSVMKELKIDYKEANNTKGSFESYSTILSEHLTKEELRAVINIQMIHDLVDPKFWMASVNRLQETDFYRWV